jgi:hypothetical protein
MTTKQHLVSIETPYNSIYPWYQIRNIQYAIQCNTHASSLGDVTWTPHICNTQFVKFGFNRYISDNLSTFFLSKMDKTNNKYFIGRDETLKRTNQIRQTKIDKVICYTDYGISSGMNSAIESAKNANIPIEYRKLPNDMKKEIFCESFQSTVPPIFKNGSIFSLATYGLLKIIKK